MIVILQGRLIDWRRAVFEMGNVRMGNGECSGWLEVFVFLAAE
jgi:hypothetical protein